MTLDLDHFTPFMSLIGGIMIGAAALILMVMNGRVMGVSGILAGLLARPVGASNIAWRLAFIIGTCIGPFLVMAVSGISIEIRPVAGGFMLMLGGLIVGLGTGIGSGCTSGHGICGLARLSPRSFVAVMTFMASAIITVALIQNLR